MTKWLSVSGQVSSPTSVNRGRRTRPPHEAAARSRLRLRRGVCIGVGVLVVLHLLQRRCSGAEADHEFRYVVQYLQPTILFDLQICLPGICRKGPSIKYVCTGGVILRPPRVCVRCVTRAYVPIASPLSKESLSECNVFSAFSLGTHLPSPGLAHRRRLLHF